MNILSLVIIFPLLGFLVLVFFSGRFSEKLSAIFGVGFIGLAALITAYISVFLFRKNEEPFSVPLYMWIAVDGFRIGFNLLLDTLSLTMLSIITGVGFLIHLFSSWYMRGEENYSRFFAYTNLFTASMIVLVLADNLLFMYLGWEGVGLCSYLLIGFYYKDAKNGIAAAKAFIMTRIGDVFLILGLFILHNELGTLNFREITELASVHFSSKNNMLCWATLMLLGGAIGKSAQFPLQNWLIGAMVGPTPASALIHAATMVTAGVYLITRAQELFILTPNILNLVGIIGVMTILLSSFSALVQTDIKCILACSTMSHIGYMFLALGARAWDAAVCHLIAHAFFKSLLFLSSASIILACYREQNIFRMGGLRRFMPLMYICFLVGSATLPLVTVGFFTKEAILAGAMANGYVGLMIIGLIGVFVTSLYTFRAIFIIFHGKSNFYIQLKQSVIQIIPLIILLIFSSFFSVFIIPSFEDILFNNAELEHNRMVSLEITSGVLTFMGILIAKWLWLGKCTLVKTIINSTLGRFLWMFLYKVWGLDWLYNVVFVKPFLKIAWFLKNDPLDVLMNSLFPFCRFVGKKLFYVGNGCLRCYIVFMSAGIIVILILLNVILKSAHF